MAFNPVYALDFVLKALNGCAKGVVSYGSE